MCDSCDNGVACEHPDCPRKVQDGHGPITHDVTLSDGTIAHLREWSSASGQYLATCGYTLPKKKTARERLSDLIMAKRLGFGLKASDEWMKGIIDALVALRSSNPSGYLALVQNYGLDGIGIGKLVAEVRREEA